MHNTPIGPTGAAMDKPMTTLRANKLKILCHCLLLNVCFDSTTLAHRRDICLAISKPFPIVELVSDALLHKIAHFYPTVSHFYPTLHHISQVTWDIIGIYSPYGSTLLYRFSNDPIIISNTISGDDPCRPMTLLGLANSLSWPIIDRQFTSSQT